MRYFPLPGIAEGQAGFCGFIYIDDIDPIIPLFRHLILLRLRFQPTFFCCRMSRIDPSTVGQGGGNAKVLESELQKLLACSNHFKAGHRIPGPMELECSNNQEKKVGTESVDLARIS